MILFIRNGLADLKTNTSNTQWLSARSHARTIVYFGRREVVVLDIVSIFTMADRPEAYALRTFVNANCRQSKL